MPLSTVQAICRSFVHLEKETSRDNFRFKFGNINVQPQNLKTAKRDLITKCHARYVRQLDRLRSLPFEFQISFNSNGGGGGGGGRVVRWR